MNITFFIGGLYGGGAERVTCNLANFFSEDGNNVEIISMSEEKKTYYINNKIKVIHLHKETDNGGKILGNIVRVLRLMRYLLKKKVDVYIVMLPVTTILLLMLRHLTDAPIIASERVDPTRYSKSIQLLLKYYSKKASKYIFQTRKIKEWYESSVKAENSYIVANPITDSFMLPRFEGVRNNHIVAVGRLTEQKNFELLIKAFSKIANNFPHTNVYIYGEGDRKEKLIRLIDDYHLNDRIILKGQVDDLAHEIRGASVFVLPSLYEGMPNALIEAMALGIPCIATDCGGGGSRELIKNGENGLLVDSNDIDMLKDAISQLLNDEELAEHMGNNARLIQSKLSKEAIFDKWKEIVYSFSK